MAVYNHRIFKWLKQQEAENHKLKQMYVELSLTSQLSKK